MGLVYARIKSRNLFLVTEESETLQGYSTRINTSKIELFSSFWDTSFHPVNSFLILR